MMREKSYKDAESWMPRTLKDEIREKEHKDRDLPDLAHGKPANREKVKGGLPARVDQVDEYTPFRCGCGRTVPAFALVDVTRIPASVRGKQRWACDACWSAWIRSEKISRAGWLRALGAPQEMVAAQEERVRKGGNPHLP